MFSNKKYLEGKGNIDENCLLRNALKEQNAWKKSFEGKTALEEKYLLNYYEAPTYAPSQVTIEASPLDWWALIPNKSCETVSSSMDKSRNSYYVTNTCILSESR